MICGASNDAVGDKQQQGSERCPGATNNGLDRVNIDSFLKILIRGLILLAALVISVYAQRLRVKAAE